MSHAFKQPYSEHWADKIKRLSANGDQQAVGDAVDDLRRRVYQNSLIDQQWLQLIESAEVCGLVIEITKRDALEQLRLQDYRCALTNLPLTLNSCEGGVECQKSIDAFFGRIDASQGYVVGNVWWLHRDVGRMKHDLSLTRLVDLCRLIAGGATVQQQAVSQREACGVAPQPKLLVSRYLRHRTEDDPLHKETSADLWQSFLAWCSVSNAEPCSQTAFGLALRGLGYKKKHGHVITWFGLRLLRK